MQKNIEKILKEHNLKNTKVRRDIFKLFFEANWPVDAIYLTEILKVNKTSVYRELKTLLDKGLVVEVEFGDGKKRYELASLDHHHHLICTKCHAVSDVQLTQDLSAEEKRIAEEKSFKVERHNLEFFGLCANCK